MCRNTNVSERHKRVIAYTCFPLEALHFTRSSKALKTSGLRPASFPLMMTLTLEPSPSPGGDHKHPSTKLQPRAEHTSVRSVHSRAAVDPDAGATSGHHTDVKAILGRFTNCPIIINQSPRFSEVVADSLQTTHLGVKDAPLAQLRQDALGQHWPLVKMENATNGDSSSFLLIFSATMFHLISFLIIKLLWSNFRLLYYMRLYSEKAMC